VHYDIQTCFSSGHDATPFLTTIKLHEQVTDVYGSIEVFGQENCYDLYTAVYVTFTDGSAGKLCQCNKQHS
jgi:hypothetical protein